MVVQEEGENGAKWQKNEKCLKQASLESTSILK